MADKTADRKGSARADQSVCSKVALKDAPWGGAKETTTAVWWAGDKVATKAGRSVCGKAAPMVAS